MGTAIGYRYGDFACQINSTAVQRAQSADISFNYPQIPVLQLGTQRMVGLVSDPTSATGTLTTLATANHLSAFGADAIAWSAGSGNFSTVTARMQIAFLSMVNVNWRVGDFVNPNANLVGKISAGSQIQNPGAPAAPYAERAPDVVLTPSYNRIQGGTFTANMPRTPLYETGNADVVGYASDPPNVRADMDLIEAIGVTLPAGTVASPVSLTAAIGGVLTVSLTLLVLMGLTYAGSVGGWGTRRGVWLSLGTDATGGMALS